MMAKVMIFGEFFEIREILSQEFAGEGHIVVATGNPNLIPEVLVNLEPDLFLIDFHLNKVNPWKMMQRIKKEFPHVALLPFTAYSNPDGNLRLVIAHPDGGKNLSLQAFMEKMDFFLCSGSFLGEGKFEKKMDSPGGIRLSRLGYAEKPPGRI